MPRPSSSVLLPLLIQLCGCASVPTLDAPLRTPTRVLVSEVVDRVRCDLHATVEDELVRHAELRWLEAWSARVHLTLVVDETASLTPGVLITRPFQNAYAVAAGPATLGGTAIAAIPQSFGLGLGGGVSSEAIRTEDLEFDVSFAELREDFRPGRRLRPCQAPDGLLLDGELGLSEWIDLALDPARAENGILRIGRNPPPGGAGTPIPTEQAAGLKAIDDGQIALEARRIVAGKNGRKADATLARIGQLAIQSKESDARFGAIEATLDAGAAGALVSEQIELSGKVAAAARRLYDYVVLPVDRAASHLPCDADLGKALAAAEYAIALTGSLGATVADDPDARRDRAELDARASAFKSAVGPTDPVAVALLASVDKVKADAARLTVLVGRQQSEEAKAAAASRTALKAFGTCQRKLDVPKGPAEYDPLSLISHQVSFIVVGNGSVAPTWRLARVTAPSTGTLAAASRKDMDTLIVAMGRSGEAVRQQVQTQQLRSALMQ